MDRTRIDTQRGFELLFCRLGLTQLLGLGSSTTFTGAPEFALQRSPFLSRTTQPDSSGMGGTLWTFNGPSVQALLTFTSGLGNSIGNVLVGCVRCWTADDFPATFAVATRERGAGGDVRDAGLLSLPGTS